MTFAAATAAPGFAGIPYASAAVVPAVEADLFNQTGGAVLLDPIPILYDFSVLAAAVSVTVTGAPATNTTYIVLQTDFGDGVWFDLEWMVTSITSGTDRWILGGGPGGGTPAHSTRTAGTAPGTSSGVQAPLGGRCRFVGQSAFTGGTNPQAAATIRYRLIGASGVV